MQNLCRQCESLALFISSNVPPIPPSLYVDDSALNIWVSPLGFESAFPPRHNWSGFSTAVLWELFDVHTLQKRIESLGSIFEIRLPFSSPMGIANLDAVAGMKGYLSIQDQRIRDQGSDTCHRDAYRDTSNKRLVRQHVQQHHAASWRAGVIKESVAHVLSDPQGGPEPG